MSETIRDKAVVIKQEAKTIIDCLDYYHGKDEFEAMKKCMKLISKVASEGVAQIEEMERRLKG